MNGLFVRDAFYRSSLTVFTLLQKTTTEAKLFVWKRRKKTIEILSRRCRLFQYFLVPTTEPEIGVF